MRQLTMTSKLPWLCRPIAALALSAFALSSPAVGHETTLRPDDLRIATIGYRLAIAGRDLCPRQGPVTGLLLHHLAEYERADRPALAGRGLHPRRGGGAGGAERPAAAP